MGALIALLGPLLSGILGHGFDDMLGAYQAHVNKEISQAELKERLQAIMVQAGTAWIQSTNNAAVQTFASFQETLRSTRVVQKVWTYFMISQITFIIWLEVGIPFLSWKYEFHYPGVGSLDTWAMGAVLACLGLGPYVMTKQPKPPT